MKFKRETLAKTPIVRDMFDFEIGHLVKSPCNECTNRENFPECVDECKPIDLIQRVIAKGVSCTTGSESD